VYLTFSENISNVTPLETFNNPNHLNSLNRFNRSSLSNIPDISSSDIIFSDGEMSSSLRLGSGDERLEISTVGKDKDKNKEFPNGNRNRNGSREGKLIYLCPGFDDQINNSGADSNVKFVVPGFSMVGGEENIGFR
jgi:hypothetical protein